MELRARAIALHLARPFAVADRGTSHAPSPPPALAARVRAWPLARRLARGIGLDVGRVTVVHVELHAGGLVGFGEGKPLGRYGESTESALRFLGDAAAALADAAPDPDEVSRRLATLPAGEHAARAAVDAAAHDLAGQLAGRPVWRLLGLARGGPPTSFTLSLADPDTMARAAERVAGRFRVLKLKLGGRDGADLDRVRAVRRVTRLPLRVDANEGWELAQALELVAQLPELGVELVEQALPAGDAGTERLRAVSPLPLFADEECRTAADVPACARRAHGINVKLAKCGGLREALRCVSAAREHGLRTMIGCMIESTLGIAAAAQVASCFDLADIDSNLLLDDDPFSGVALVDGVQLPSEGPGLGVRPVRGR